MNLQNILQNTNFWYKDAFETNHPRRYVFYDVLNQLSGPANILEIGTTGGDIHDVTGIHGSGHSTFYFAEYVRQNGGKLTVVELDRQILENCKIMLGDFLKAGVNIEFVCDDGANWVGKKYDLYYLDASDIEWQTYEMFRKIDLRNGSVLLDDWNDGGKCTRIKKFYIFYDKEYKCGPTHQMGYYKKMNNYGGETFKIGELELPYYRGWEGNREATNERSIEISLGRWFISKFDDAVELGAVMPYYSYWGEKFAKTIVDPYDNHKLCLKVDGENYDYTNKDVLSISSLEHIGYDAGYDKEKDPQKAIRTLEKVIKQSKNYLLCWGVGQHPELDNYIQKSNLPIKIMVRNNYRGLVNDWTENNDKNNLFLPYGSWDLGCGYYGNSLGIVVVSNIL